MWCLRRLGSTRPLNISSNKGSWSLSELNPIAIASDGKLISREKLQHLAQLSRLELTATQLDDIAQDVDEIVRFATMVQVGVQA